jgi:hypothetical protein
MSFESGGEGCQLKDRKKGKGNNTPQREGSTTKATLSKSTEGQRGSGTAPTDETEAYIMSVIKKYSTEN